ncbi:MAG: HAD hydrolase-like protein [Candidatus Micrarchaeota archaeon]|nr:HAD hydrolase-like protein [Candidatus Micrarchaeota archaeon]MDE1848070.1 HAD hydrolase-like protein [Candidatus Micrarchaeota archaeon]MDE1864875.1 HAD hydrolase-like protein [Candidatus Micrarchaeota archaeon]
MIKTIVLDLGGVYFSEGTPKAIGRIAKFLGVPKRDVFLIFRGNHPYPSDIYHAGKMTKREFWRIVRKKLDINVNLSEKMREIWNSSYTPTPGMEKLVSRLKRGYRIVCFSGNTRDRVAYLEGKYKFKRNFDSLLFSFSAHFNKSNIGFYLVLLKRIKCRPDECVVVDDYPKFLRRASSLGVKIIHFKSARQLGRDLAKLGVKV